MPTYQFRCIDCGVLFEATVYQQNSPIPCEFCESHNVKKLCAVTALEERDDESLLENEC